MNRLLLAAIALTAAIALGGIYLLATGGVSPQPPAGNSAPVRTTGTPDVGGPFTLVNQDGETVTQADFEGQYTLIYFGFTSCPDVCPTALQVMAAALDEMGESGDNITPVFITVDPERDDVETVRSYVKHFGPRFVGLTGTPEQIAQVTDAYKVYYRKVEDPNSAAPYTMDHSSVVYLMGPDGQFLANFTHATSPERMAAILENRT